MNVVGTASDSEFFSGVAMTDTCAPRVLDYMRVLSAGGVEQLADSGHNIDSDYAAGAAGVVGGRGKRL